MVKKAKKTTTKTKTAKRKKKAPKVKRGFPLSRLIKAAVKWSFVLGLWAALALILITAWYARELPSITKDAKFERRAAITILTNDGQKLVRIGELKDVSVQIEDVPDYLRYAVISIEDRRFYSHNGIDPQGIARAIYTKLFKGGRLAGGSTLTQQLAKNLFLSHERRLKRKIQEALLALWLEHSLSKDEILTAYLNRVYFGGGNYGIEAAAQSYFDKHTSELNLAESAMIAGLLKAPSRYAPTNSLERAQKRGRLVLNAMVEEGYITRAEAEMQAGLSVTRPKPRPLNIDTGRYFADFILGEAARLISVPEQDIIIESTIDPELQNASQRALNTYIKRYGKDKNIAQGATLSLGKDGAIYAMVGGVNYRQSQFNRATQAKRPPGSALKPFIYLCALEQGWAPDDMITDAVIEDEDYAPENYNDKYYGEVPLYEALSKSMNTASVRLMQEVGIGCVIRKLRASGVTSPLNRDLSLALGSSGMSMLELSAAYTSFLNGGLYSRPYGINRILTKDGEVLYDHATSETPPHRVSKKRHISRLNTMMAHVVQYGTGRSATIEGTKIYGKTGTSQNFRDAWFVGYSDQLVSAVWLGNDDNTPMDRVSGGSLPPKIWKEIALAAQKDQTLAVRGDREKSSSFNSLLNRVLGLNE